MSSLILNGKEIRYEEIQNIPDSGSSSMLRFCKDWLNGKKQFSLFTSGSTGKPKEIILHREQLIASARMTALALGLKQGDRSFICLNTEFIAGMMMLVRGFELEMRMTVVEPSANPLKNISPSSRFEFTAMVPMQMQKILEESPDKICVLDDMKAILLGGSPVSARLEEQLQSIKAPVYSTYGMTETVSHIALRRLNGEYRSELYSILDGVHTGIDERGCLTISAPTTKHHTIITNDLVELSGKGMFRWLGRIDNVINSGGFKIHTDYLEEKIDRIFHEAGLSNRLFICPMPDAQFGEIAVLAVEGKIDQEKISALLKDTLKKFEVPKKIVVLGKFHETATGKIDRIASRKLL
ncbi:MAG: AMP-binding protein [Cytophagaceae bacterium]